MSRHVLAAFALVWSLAAGVAAQPAALAPGATYDPKIPTLEAVLGHDVGRAHHDARGDHRRT